MKSWLRVLVSLLIVCSCGDESAPIPTDTGGDHRDVFDGMELSDLVPGDHPETVGEAGSLDGESPEIGPTDPGPMTDLPGEPGASCTDNDQCLSGFCVETGDDWVCSRPCSDSIDCDPGFDCVRVSVNPDGVRACVYRAPRVSDHGDVQREGRRLRRGDGRGGGLGMRTLVPGRGR